MDPTDARHPPQDPRESPTKVVATVEDRPARASRSESIDVCSDAAMREPDKPVRRHLRRWVLLALLATTVGVVAALMIERGSNAGSNDLARPVGVDEPSPSPESTPTAAQPVPTSIATPGRSVDPEDVIDVGRLAVVNGAELLDEVRRWHHHEMSARGAPISEGASCWYGRLGQAAAESVHCGPVMGSAGDRLLFDFVPLRFINDGTGLEAQALYGDVRLGQPRPPGLISIAVDGHAPEDAEVPRRRGQRDAN